MNRYMLYLTAITTLVGLVSFANAQEPAAETKPAEPAGVPAALEERYQQMAEQLKQELPKREIKLQFVEAVKAPPQGADPKLLENKFTGTLVLQPAGVDFADQTFARQYLQRLQLDQIEMRKYPIDLQQLLFVGDMSLLHVKRHLRSFEGLRVDFDEGKQQSSDRFQLLVKQCAPELAPKKEMMDYLTSADCNRDVSLFLGEFNTRFRDGSVSTNQRRLFYHVFAPTADEVEQRVRAIVRLYDAGFLRPMQQYLLGEGQKALQTARSQYIELAQLAEAIRVENENLAKPSEISGDILSQLKAQKVMVAVELAGLSARVKACDAMLTDPRKLEISALQSVSDMKVKAEIERVGIKEKLDQINLFITEGDIRTAARSRRDELSDKHGRLQGRIQQSEQNATWHAELFTLYAPFQVPDNQITVTPIEWTQP